MEKNIVFCAECGSEINHNEAIRINDGNYICSDCMSELYFVCDDCGEVFKRDDMNTVYDRYNDASKFVCDSCSNNYFLCNDCGNLHYESDVETVGYNYICNECLEDGYYNVCDDCGEWFSEDDLYYNERNDCYYCEDCSPSHEIIAGYHDHTNEIQFFGDDKLNSVPYLGVELEIDKGNDNEKCAEHTESCFPKNFIYFEYDGSLDDGFENITQPATLDYHYSLKENYGDMFKNAISMGFRSHNTSTCGLHVHFNRDFFRDNEELYVTRLLYLVEKFWDELVKFSRRDIEHLNRWAKKYDKSPEDVVNEWKSHAWYLERYQAVNLTNARTIEFRMFRGTLKLNTFIATLQLCNTLVKTAREIESTEAIQSLKWEDMLQYDEIKAYWEEVKNR